MHVGLFELWPAARRLRQQGRSVAITPRAFDVLVTLARHYPGMVGKGTLLAAVWPNLVVEENNLQVQISLLRKLLGHNAITTLPGHGYRLNLPVSGGSAAHNGLPVPVGLLLGRDDDLAELCGLLRQHRLTSLLGAGGVGKTALARHAAAAMATTELVVCWADLGECVCGDELPDCVARGAGLDDAAPGALARHLARQPCLLVLDNADRLAGETAALALDLLARVPALRLLVTTQVRLHVPEEQVYRLTPLAVPPERCGIAEAGRYGALALLQARAHGHDHRFLVTEDNLADVVALCRALDGLPLALELAAARIPALGVAGLLRRLGDGMTLLANAHGGGPARHQSLRDAIEWSYWLLEPAAQTLWCETAAMPTRFALDDLLARHAACDAARTLDLLGTLVDRSLLIFDAGLPAAYTLAASHRAFALDKRVPAGQNSPPIT